MLFTKECPRCHKVFENDNETSLAKAVATHTRMKHGVGRKLKAASSRPLYGTVPATQSTVDDLLKAERRARRALVRDMMDRLRIEYDALLDEGE